MAQSASLQTVGVDKLLKKLDKPTLLGPAQKIVFAETAGKGASFLHAKLGPRFPVTAGTVKTELKPESASIRAARHPYVFFERGSQYPTGGTRTHRIRRGVKTSGLRIKPRRFLSKTRSEIKKNLPAALDKAAQSVEKVWAS